MTTTTMKCTPVLPTGHPTIDVADIRRRAAGRWREILATLGGIDAALFDGKNHPCPKCGDNDRFRMIDAEAGALCCNRCFAKSNGDGIAALRWLNDWDLSTTVDALAAYLGCNDATGKPKGANKPRIVAIYDYRDEQRALLYQVLRYDPKDFRQRRPRDGGGWEYTVKGTRRVLYRLPELLASDLSVPVFVVEGEKDADRATSIGLVATTCAMGAGKWRPEFSEHLRGRDVVIIPDNDAAGHQHAKQVAGALHGIAANVKIVELSDISEKDDLSDWLDAGHTKDELNMLVEAAPLWTPAADQEGAAAYVPFPTDVLPRVVANFIHNGANALGCDEAFVALPLLAMLASAFGNSRRIQLKRSWREPAILWTAVVAQSGTLKSPAQELALTPMQRLQTVAFAEHADEMLAYRTEKASYEADLGEWRKKGHRHGDPPPNEPEEPVATRYLVSDTTVEALADLLAVQPRGLLVARDELSGWFGAFDAYKHSRGADAAHWLSMHRAGQFTVDRKSGRRISHVPRAAVSIAGGIQPGALAAALRGSSREHFENGLAARLLLAMPPRQPKKWTDDEIPLTTEAALESLVVRLVGLVMPEDTNGRPQPVDIPLSQDGRDAWVKFYNAHGREQATMSGDLAAAWSKLEGYAARFALLIHVIRVESGDPSLADPMAVDAESINAGVVLSRWFGDEAARVYAVIGGNVERPEDRQQRDLIRLIQAQGGRITANDLRRRSRSYTSSEEAETALQRLVDAGVGRWESTAASQLGGRPTRYFVLHDASAVSETPANSEENAGLGYGDSFNPFETQSNDIPDIAMEVVEWRA